MSDSRRPMLILGSHGQVGWELRRTLAPLGAVVAVDRVGRVDALADLSDLDRLRHLLDQLQPGVIVNAAAYTDVDRADNEEDLAYRINVEAPAVLGEWATDARVPIVHYSTDYVFDGTKATPYVETDVPNPLNAYGRTKLGGDNALMDSGADVVILRGNWMYGNRGDNFLLTMRRLLAERDEVQVIDDQLAAPAWCRPIAEASAQVIGQLLRGTVNVTEARGIYHLTPGGETSWYGYAQTVCEIGEYSCRVQPVPTADYPSTIRRPLNSRLDCSKIEQRFGIRLPDWRSLLIDCLECS